MSAHDAGIHPLAQQLDDALESAAPETLAMLSSYGRRIYFPRGIVSQTAEAAQKASRANATIGIATRRSEAMHLPSIQRHLVEVEPNDALTYAPTTGRPRLRERWRAKLLAENPSLGDKRFGLPIVTSAITHGLSLVGDLFVDEGDRVLIPDKLWGNYRLLYETRFGATVVTYPFYDGPRLHTAAFADALAEQAAGRDKLIALLNFPNNPTGYTPTPAEGEALVSALVERAQQGTKIAVVLDDAYFGLFYHLGARSMTESLFGALTNRHPNLLAIKLDGATKEFFAWGLRCGFITFGPGRAESADEVAGILETKARGAIRGGISSVSQLSQTLVEQALASPSIEEERRANRELLRERAQRVYEVVQKACYRESFEAYPFNSGYFMCVKVIGVDAEKLRVHLLDDYGVGLVATSPTDVRVAFSCLELDEIEPLFETLHGAVQELR